MDTMLAVSLIVGAAALWTTAMPWGAIWDKRPGFLFKTEPTDKRLRAITEALDLRDEATTPEAKNAADALCLHFFKQEVDQ